MRDELTLFVESDVPSISAVNKVVPQQTKSGEAENKGKDIKFHLEAVSN